MSIMPRPPGPPLIDPSCRAGVHEECEAILAYGECTCQCHAEQLELLRRQEAAAHARRRAGQIRAANGIPHAGRPLY